MANNSKFYCMVSGKSFKSRKAYENHLNSKKYKEMLLKYEALPPKESFVNAESEDEEEYEDMEIEVRVVDEIFKMFLEISIILYFLTKLK